MHTSRWSRSLILYAAIVLPTSQALINTGCSSEPPAETVTLDEEGLPSMEGGLPQCAQYQSSAETNGSCVYKFAGGFPSIDEVNRLCPMAGEWERECRHAWVSGRMNASSGVDTQTLLEVCGENIDCTFELLDFRPSTDVLEQIALCTKYTGDYGRDCTGHAMQRWWHSKPDADDTKRVAQTPTAFPDRVGYYIAVNVACGKTGSCEGDPRMQTVCEKAADNFQRNPDRCPPQEKRPLHPNVRPQDLIPKTGHNQGQAPQKPKRPPQRPPQ
ncbi:MAG: hypothetical protein VXZ96_14710 [Myxococcota bacterium]|nr:hypothetical protein [Myxococcota bacterium]